VRLETSFRLVESEYRKRLAFGSFAASSARTPSAINGVWVASAIRLSPTPLLFVLGLYVSASAFEVG
jgi:hypothetical protein